MDAQTVAKVARLARIHLDDKDLPILQERLTGILKWVSMLDEVETTNVEPMFSVHLETSPVREDVVTCPPMVNDILANAPEKELDMFVVPKMVG
ncbi:MAG: Asp-tRNA(Asn)/Glu-tRNA(Gln) amidotransferase GatCAB subunit C [Candidatus Puniceispirillum sp.]|nr:Asp-tRNA(Asn)/Glu-tRNA(Gln) amidotransferase GatCAB subunit C [Candidatus Puniceispirillum sp.]